MIVCSCKCVTFDQIAQAVDTGAGSVAAVGQVCGAGTDCGSCHEQIARMVEGRTDDVLMKLGRCPAKVPAFAA
jgi:bacterioferritin-associated ferredoxin